MKVFKSKCMIIKDRADFVPYVCRILLYKNKITFNVSAKEIEIEINPEVLYDIIWNVVVSGYTYIKDDTKNHVRIRYTKGFGQIKSDPESEKHTTISVAPLDEHSDEIYQISVDCTELDEYIRKRGKSEI